MPATKPLQRLGPKTNKQRKLSRRPSKLTMLKPDSAVSDYNVGNKPRGSMIPRGELQPSFPSIKDPFNITQNYMEGANRGSRAVLFSKLSRQTLSQRSSCSTISKAGSCVRLDTGNGYSDRSHNPKMAQFEMVKRRIDKTLRSYEEATHMAVSENMNDEEKFLQGIMEKLDKGVKNHMLRIDVAMLVDRYRRVTDRFGLSNSRKNAEIDEEHIDDLLDDIEEWVSKANEIDNMADEGMEGMDDSAFTELVKVDPEVMVEGDLKKLKEKFAQLSKMNRQLNRAGTLTKEDKMKLMNERNMLQQECADKIKQNNEAKSNNAGFMHAADEIFHLMEKSRAEGGGKDASRYQQEVAEVLKELVKRDQLASGQNKKMKAVQAELDRTKIDFNTLITEHKALKVEADSLRDKYDKANQDLTNAKKKVLTLQKSTKEGAAKIMEHQNKQDSENRSKDIIEAKAQNKKLTDALKVMENKYQLLSESLKDREQQIQDQQHQISRASQLVAVQESDKVGSLKPNKKGKKGSKKSSMNLTKSTANLDDASSQEQIVKLKNEVLEVTKKFDAAVRNEQLISQKLSRKETDLKQMTDQFDQCTRKLDFQNRELDMVKANLDVLEKQSGKSSKAAREAAKNFMPPAATVKTKQAIMQTEIRAVKTDNTQCDFPIEELCLGELEGRGSNCVNLGTIVQILNHKAGITDASRILKYFKKTNEQEIKRVQAQIYGHGEALDGGNQADTGFIRDLNSNATDGDSGDAAENAREVTTCFLSSASTIGSRLGDITVALRQSMCLKGEKMLPDSPEANRLNTLEEICEDINEDIENIVPGFCEASMKDAKTKSKVKLQKLIRGRMGELRANDMRIVGNRIVSALSKGVEMFSQFALDECTKMNTENRNLRKRLANKNNMSMAQRNDDFNFDGAPISDTHNPDQVLDDIEHMLQSRLSVAKRRASTVNFSNLMSSRPIGGLTVKKLQQKATSTKSDPVSRTIVRRQPSVMSVMRSMNTTKPPAEEPSLGHTANRSRMMSNAFQTPFQIGGIGVSQNNRRPDTQPAPSRDREQWMGRFEREFQQTKLRNHRAQVHKNSAQTGGGMAGNGLAGSPASQMNFSANRLGNNNKRGPSSKRLESMLTKTVVSRNRLNPVFGSNLPRSVSGFR